MDLTVSKLIEALSQINIGKIQDEEWSTVI